MATKTYRFLDPGSPLITIRTITAQMKRIKLVNKQERQDITVGSYARVHSHTGSNIVVWVNEDKAFETLILEVPTDLMGQLFKQHSHGLFPHFS